MGRPESRCQGVPLHHFVKAWARAGDSPADIEVLVSVHWSRVMLQHRVHAGLLRRTLPAPGKASAPADLLSLDQHRSKSGWFITNPGPEAPGRSQRVLPVARPWTCRVPPVSFPKVSAFIGVAGGRYSAEHASGAQAAAFLGSTVRNAWRSSMIVSLPFVLHPR